MNRRTFLCGLTVGTLGAPRAARAQPTGRKMSRVGLLQPGLPQPGMRSPAWVEAFRKGLRELGYVEGLNIAVEHRLAARSAEQRAVVAEFMRLKVDVIVTWGMPAVLAAKHAIRAIPVVGLVPDPVETDFLTGLARLNRTFTGACIQPDKRDLKALRLLRAALPTVSRISVLRSTKPDPRSAGALNWFDKYPPIFGHAVNVLILDDSFVTGPLKHILDLRPSQWLPVSSENSALIVDKHGFMKDGVVFPDILHRAAVYVDKVLRGARAAGLPIEEPTKYELIIDMTTAKALGLTIPQLLLLPADQIIN
jgi:putative tryptophan/tyrosine transport system substrate-binding protein